MAEKKKYKQLRGCFSVSVSSTFWKQLFRKFLIVTSSMQIRGEQSKIMFRGSEQLLPLKRVSNQNGGST